MSERSASRLAVFGTVVMSIAALASSWAGYQATLWSGEQAQHAARAGALRTRQTLQATRAGQLRAVDVGMFVAWLGANTRGDTMLARVLARRFRPEFRVAFESWMATDPVHSPTAAPSPFALGQYHVAADDSAAHLERAANAASTASTDANHFSDAYVLNTVIFAMALFFAGAAQQSEHRHTQIVLVAIAVLVCVAGIYRLCTSPHG